MTTLRPLLLLLGGLAFFSCSDDDPVIPIGPNQPVFVDSPDQIEIITSDIDLFWQVYDEASGIYTSDDFLTNYFRGGSEELSLFYDAKIKNSARLTGKLSDDDYHLYYTSIRENTESINSNRLTIESALDQFELNYPEAVYTDLALVVGALGTGGTVVSNGSMVIGVEFFTKTPSTPTGGLDPWVQEVTRELNYLPAIVIHELVHVQQRNFAIKENLSSNGTLLEIALAEGIADFVTDLVLSINFNDHLPAYADPVEEALWSEFQAEMTSTNVSNWLFNAGSSSERPADLGYYIGYKIAEYYYEQQVDKTTALKELLEVRDANEFLTKSDYSNKF